MHFTRHVSDVMMVKMMVLMPFKIMTDIKCYFCLKKKMMPKDML